MSARFTAEEADVLDDLAEKRDIYLSQLVRQIVREYMVRGAQITIHPLPIAYGAYTTGNARTWRNNQEGATQC